MKKAKIPKIIKSYQYQLGNNKAVGNPGSGGYSDEVPKWYRLQAELYEQGKHHQLVGASDPDDEGAGGHQEGSTFWSAEDYEGKQRLTEDEWGKYVSEHDIFLPTQAQSDIDSLKEQGLI